MIVARKQVLILEYDGGGVRQTWSARTLVLQSLDDDPSLDFVLR